PKSKSQLAANKQFQGRASRTMLDLWWRSISEAESVELGEEERSSDFIPNHRSWEKRFPEAHARLAATRPLIVDKATELAVPVENLLTPDILRRVCFEPAENLEAQLALLGARKWQVELCAPLIGAGLDLAITPPTAEV
ncbi:MAG: ribonuclease D, partial [Aquiluna sp.]